MTPDIAKRNLLDPHIFLESCRMSSFDGSVRTTFRPVSHYAKNATKPYLRRRNGDWWDTV